ncbi:MAG: 50S ribosomal protein L11 methyltransferase [Acidimicrobiales bacterium]
MHTNLTERDDDRPVLARLDLTPGAVSRAQIELLITDLFDRGATAVEEQGTFPGAITLLSGFPNRSVARAALASLADGLLVGSALVEVPEDTWFDGWRAFARTNRAGHHFVLHPPWLPVSAEDVRDGDVWLAIDPGRSFGSGAHATTRLVLAQLEKLVGPGMSMLDVGCGSGVLSVAAARLGADPVVAVDIDAEALRATEENLARNAVAATVGAELPDPAARRERFDVVAANIGANTLIELAPRLVALGHTLVLSGFLDQRADEVVAAYLGLGATVVELQREAIDGSAGDSGDDGDGWVAVTVRVAA